MAAITVISVLVMLKNAAARRPAYKDAALMCGRIFLLKVKKSWLYDAVESGALEAVRLGKQLRFRPSALARYLDERVRNVNEG